MTAPPRLGTVLIVDDESFFRRSLRMLLQLEGWQVIEAADGEEALALVRARDQRPDLMLLDQRMPGLTGTATFRRLREEGIDIPTILITAASDFEQLARSAGIAHCIRKPFDFEQLRAVLARVAPAEKGS